MAKSRPVVRGPFPLEKSEVLLETLGHSIPSALESRVNVMLFREQKTADY